MIYIHDSYFEDLSSDYGGALYLYNSNTEKKLLVESSIFTNCSDLGGGIYMRYGHCILSKLCGIECKADNSGPLSDVVLNSDNAINKILESTVSKCSSEENGSPLSHHYGNIDVVLLLWNMA